MKNLKEDFDKLVSQLENMILGGSVQPKERLVENDLANELGVSRFWIRDALKVLETKGLIKVIPYKGAMVCDIDENEIEELFEIRIELECLAARKAAQSVKKRDIDFLKRMAEQFEKSVQKNIFSEMISANTRFHDYILELCGNKNLVQLIKQLQTRCHIIRYHAWSSPEVIAAIQSEHRELIESLGSKNYQRLNQLSVQHITYSKISYLTHLRTRRARMMG
jgi:DNA-binding GntR family transcriptional regulator